MVVGQMNKRASEAEKQNGNTQLNGKAGPAEWVGGERVNSFDLVEKK